MKPVLFNLLRLSATVLSLAGLLCLNGCKSYQLGHPAEIPFKTIFVQPAANDSFAPQAQALISSKVREEIIRDGRVKLVANENRADAVLRITLSDYQRITGTRNQTDTEVAQDYDIILQATVDLYHQANGNYLIQSRTVSERTTAYVNNTFTPPGDPQTQGLIQSEYQAMPRIAREIGQKVADLVLSSW